MTTRLFSSAAIGVAVTTGLLFLMQFLIASGEEIIIEPRAGHTLAFVRLKKMEVVQTIQHAPERIDRPELPPDSPRPRSDDTGATGVTVPAPPPASPGGMPSFTGPSLGDGPLVSMILVAPQYPRIAATKGLEGTVLVQFDVTETGSVANVIVVESSNRVFENASVTAAYRFRYKPGIVDGRPYMTKGLRYLFRFEMDE